MGIIQSVVDAATGTLADQWLDIYTAGTFNEHMVVAPGILKNQNNGRGGNNKGSLGVISNGSKIYVPENTAAFIFSENAIENVITQPGAYEYQDGEASIFNGDSVGNVVTNLGDRVRFGGISQHEKKIAYINLREIRNFKFGTKGPQMFNDPSYGIDVQIRAFGSISIKVVNPEIFVKNFVPANTSFYTFDDERARSQLLAEFLQSFSVALNSLSSQFRVSQLLGQSNAIEEKINADRLNVGTWEERFGIKLMQIGIENIELTDESKQLLQKYASNKVELKAYDDVSMQASNIAAQQHISQGIQNNGLGNGGGMVFGMNMANNLNPYGSMGYGYGMGYGQSMDGQQGYPQNMQAQQDYQNNGNQFAGGNIQNGLGANVSNDVNNSFNNGAVNTASAAADVAKSDPYADLSFDQKIDMVNKLDDLRCEGIISDEEFQIKKKQLLGL